MKKGSVGDSLFAGACTFLLSSREVFAQTGTNQSILEKKAPGSASWPFCPIPLRSWKNQLVDATPAIYFILDSRKIKLTIILI
jgi:hypothetical protein